MTDGRWTAEHFTRDLRRPCCQAGNVAYAARAAWVLDSKGSRTIRLDPTTGEPTGEVALTGGGRMIFAVGDHLWAIDSTANRLVGIDPDSLEVAAELDLGGVSSARGVFDNCLERRS